MPTKNLKPSTLEELALAIRDEQCYHIFQGGTYMGRSFYYPKSASAFLASFGDRSLKVKYLTNQVATQERKWA